MLFCFVFGIIATDAWAGSTREPAACLLFPYFNTNPDNLAVFSITNVGSDPVSVRLVWIDEEDCSPEDQWIQLSGNDTFTFLDQAMNPEGEQGFMYAYVYEGSGSPANANCLVGQEIIIGTWDPQNPLIQYGINAVGFQAINVVADQKLHLDGVEYSLAPKSVIFPRFFGQDQVFLSKVILINLTGGKFFTARASIMTYNDNESGFSSSVEFPCFWFGNLVDLSSATKESFLQNTNHDPLEIWDGNSNPNAYHKKTGWMKITGKSAYYLMTDIEYASSYAVLVEEIETIFAGSLPWQINDPVKYTNGMLWSTSPTGK